MRQDKPRPVRVANHAVRLRDGLRIPASVMQMISI
jgi:hypothetical protein